MQATDVAPSRLVVARDAASDFVDAIPNRIKVGLVSFNHSPAVAQAPTADHGAVQRALSALKPSGGTATGDALNAALEARPEPACGKRRPPQAIVLPPDPATMAAIAQTSRGKTYRTANAGALAEVYSTLGSQLATKKEEREMTSAVAGISLLLMLSGSGLSLGWFGRPA